mmetsp:Transcript_17683/g.67264  ORF Transcript_17683/g.67264 Transcript_17683/m.67264 type:complete len:411 (-) Transcript_17683:87-1319(-)
MRAVQLTVVLLLLGALVSEAAKSSGEKAMQKRRRQMDSAMDGDGIVEFSTDMFMDIVLKKRDFGLVLLFTAQAPQYNCVACLKAGEAMRKASRAYQQSLRGQRAAFYFCVVDVDLNRPILGRYSITRAPHTFMVPPQESKGDPVAGADDMFRYEDYQAISGQSFAAKVGEVFGVKLKIRGDATFSFAIIALVTILMATVSHFVDDRFDRAVAFVRQKWIWMIASFLIYAFGVSGSVSCIIRGTALYNEFSQPGPTVFSTGSRDQFVLEGLAVAGLSFAIAATVVAAVSVARNVSVDSSKVWIWTAFLGAVRVVLTTLLMALLCVLLGKLFQLYTLKTRWYRIVDTLPPQMRQLFVAPGKLKKSAGLIRRLIKASYYGLFQAPTFSAVLKKFDAIVLSYLKRLVREYTGLL